MGRFTIGLAILFSIVILMPIVWAITPEITNLIISTTAATSMFIYLVPAVIVVGGLVAVFVVWFKPFGKFGGE